MNGTKQTKSDFEDCFAKTEMKFLSVFVIQILTYVLPSTQVASLSLLLLLTSLTLTSPAEHRMER